MIRKKNLALLIAATVLIVGLALYDLTRPRLPGPFIVTDSGEKIFSFVPASDRLRLPGAKSSDQPRFASSSTDRGDDMWGLTGEEKDWTLNSWRFDPSGRIDSGKGRYREARQVRVDQADQIPEFDIGEWGTSGTNLFIFDRQGGGISVERVRLGNGSSAGDLVQVGETPALPPPGEQGLRTLEIARQSGRLPDLYVIDARPDGTWRGLIYSGESGFRTPIGQFRTPRIESGLLEPGDWEPSMIGLPGGRPPDLALLARGRESASNHVELAVVTSAESYSKVLFSIPTTLPGKLSRRHQLIFGPVTRSKGNEFDLEDLRGQLLVGSFADIFPQRSRMVVRRLLLAY